MAISKDAVLDRLRTIQGPDFEGDIVSLGLVSDIFIAEGKVFFSVTVPAEAGTRTGTASRGGRAPWCVRWRAWRGVTVALTAERKGGGHGIRAAVPAGAPARSATSLLRHPRQRPPAGQSGKRGVPRQSPRSSRSPAARAGWANPPPPSNLALGLAAEGKKVGILRRRHLRPVASASPRL